MSDDRTVGDLDRSVGYLLKQAAAALRGSMDAALRPLDLTVPQYACLELLGRQPGLSSAELARGAFVTRQATHGVLRGLHDRGLVSRQDTATHGRALPTRLTDEGQRVLRAASTAVRAVEDRMLSGLGPERRELLCDDLTSCVSALEP
jgi:DNA-binding MarR family transcriptional regulator